MKKNSATTIFLIPLIFLSLLFFAVGLAGAGDFKLARAKFDVEEDKLLASDNKVDAGLWDVGVFNGVDQSCEGLLKSLEKQISIKVYPKVPVVDFKDLNSVCQYPFIFMHASGTIKMTDEEKNNMKEYLKRGGFIFAEDCVFHKFGGLVVAQPDNYFSYSRYMGELFFQSFKKMMEKDIIPGKKMIFVPFDHAIYNCFYKFPKGLPYIQGEPHGGWGYVNEKGKIQVFLSSNDIHCGWSGNVSFPEDRRKEAIKMAANIIIYAFTH